jgi:hypothetical protein
MHATAEQCYFFCFMPQAYNSLFPWASNIVAMTTALFAYIQMYFIFHMTISISKDLWNVKE